MRRALAFGLLWLVALTACTSSGGSTPARGEPAPSHAASHERGQNPAPGAGHSSRGQAATRFHGKRMAVRLRITPSRVASGEAPSAVLINIGEGRLGYGLPFKLERRTDHGWRWVNKRQGFNLPLLFLAPGEQSAPQPMAVYVHTPKPLSLRQGLYRVTKGVSLSPGKPRPRTVSVSATFRVTPA